MPKRKPQKRSTPKVKRVKLTPDAVVHVKATAGVVPVVVQNPQTGAAVIVPVKTAVIAKRSWLKSLFG